MKCNTQELDTTDNAAVATYFENQNALKVNNWELSSEQLDATKDLFTRVAAENCFGEKLLTYAKFAELLPVSSFLKLEHNAVACIVLEVLSYVLTSIYAPDSWDYTLLFQPTYEICLVMRQKLFQRNG